METLLCRCPAICGSVTAVIICPRAWTHRPQGFLVGDERGRDLWTVDATLGREEGERDRNMRPGWIMSCRPWESGVSPSKVLTART